jgi:TonB-dependent SusC/RagA subfamily outer membrane receptor
MNGRAIPNAIVEIDGMKTLKVTDEDGYYNFNVDTSKIRKIRVIISQQPIYEYNYSGEIYLTFKFPLENIAYEKEKVDLGYKNEFDASLSYESTTINSKKVNHYKYQSISQMIINNTPRSRLNGAMLVVLNGAPVEGGLTALNHSFSPKQIKSISVLRGAAAGIYGMKGFNGVIVVKTI